MFDVPPPQQSHSLTEYQEEVEVFRFACHQPGQAFDVEEPNVRAGTPSPLRLPSGDGYCFPRSSPGSQRRGNQRRLTNIAFTRSPCPPVPAGLQFRLTVEIMPVLLSRRLIGGNVRSTNSQG